jgi:hypothetical protein
MDKLIMKKIVVLFLATNLLLFSQVIQYGLAESVKPPSGLVSWWSGDEHALDIHNGNHGTLMGSTTYATGLIDQAFSFDNNIDDYVLMHGHGINELQQLTIELWVQIDVLRPFYQRFVYLEGAKAVLRHDGITDYHLFGLGQLHFYMNFGGAPWEDKDDLYDIRVNGVLKQGVWHHVAGTYDGSEMRLYLDGVLLDSRQVSGTLFNGDGVHLSWWNEPLDGLLDEIGIYNRALTAKEIFAIYYAGSSGKEGKVWREPVAQCKYLIQNLPDEAFKNFPDYRRNRLLNQFDRVITNIDAERYWYAIFILRNIRRKCDGSLGGFPGNDWIIDPESQQELCANIDMVLSYLYTLI